MTGCVSATPASFSGGRLKGPHGGRGCTLADMLATAGKLGVEECKERRLGSKWGLGAQAAFALSFYQFGICVNHYPFINKEFGFG